MIKLENFEVVGWEHAIRGMRNPMNSWEKSDTSWDFYFDEDFNKITKDSNTTILDMLPPDEHGIEAIILGNNDKTLMMNLRNAGTDHRKFMRMITVYVDITAPLYWWKEFDTYKVGTVANSCSTMHKIHEKEFTLEDFSCEHLFPFIEKGKIDDDLIFPIKGSDAACSSDLLSQVIWYLNVWRYKYIETNDKKYWWQMIQLLPTSYNQKRTIMFNYEVLANIYKSRRNHKLDEWHGFCDWIEKLPYSELITGGKE